jgi:DNA-binding protein Alba
MESVADMDKKGNIIFIGKKPSMSYVLAVVTQFNSQKEVQIRARGKAISKAVDVAEIVRNKFLKEARISGITIGTEEISAEAEKINVSTIEICLAK